MSLHRERIQRQFEASSWCSPNMPRPFRRNPTRVLRHSIFAGFCDKFLAGFRFVDCAPDIRLFVDHNAGFMILCTMLLSGEVDDVYPPVLPVTVSSSALSRRFGVSRAHVRRLLQDAENQGLLERLDGDRVRLLPRLAQAVSDFMASNFLLVADCAQGALADIARESAVALIEKLTVVVQSWQEFGVVGLAGLALIFALGALTFLPRFTFTPSAAWCFGFAAIPAAVIGTTAGAAIAFLLAPPAPALQVHARHGDTSQMARDTCGGRCRGLAAGVPVPHLIAAARRPDQLSVRAHRHRPCALRDRDRSRAAGASHTLRQPWHHREDGDRRHGSTSRPDRGLVAGVIVLALVIVLCCVACARLPPLETRDMPRR